MNRKKGVQRKLGKRKKGVNQIRISQPISDRVYYENLMKEEKKKI